MKVRLVAAAAAFLCSASVIVAPFADARSASGLSAPSAVSADYVRVSSRTWKQIAKNPDAYTGKQLLVYGVITQFDAATGQDLFRADAGPYRSLDWYDYDTNALFGGSESRLADFVEDDIFAAKVIVVGSYTYDTQIGGSTTVPMFKIVAIKRIGTA